MSESGRTSTGNLGRRMLFVALTLASLGHSLARADQALLWSEEFDSGPAPDPSIWSYDLGASGWGNRELQEYTDLAENAMA